MGRWPGGDNACSSYMLASSSMHGVGAKGRIGGIMSWPAKACAEQCMRGRRDATERVDAMAWPEKWRARDSGDSA